VGFLLRERGCRSRYSYLARGRQQRTRFRRAGVSLAAMQNEKCKMQNEGVLTKPDSSFHFAFCIFHFP
jgi:hypothetical protein